MTDSSVSSGGSLHGAITCSRSVHVGNVGGMTTVPFAHTGGTMDINTLTFAFVLGALAIVGVIVYKKGR